MSEDQNLYHNKNFLKLCKESRQHSKSFHPSKYPSYRTLLGYRTVGIRESFFSKLGKRGRSQLAVYIKKTAPDIKGFSDKNLWRMKQFYELYKDNEKLSALTRELPWTHNTIIFSRCKTEEEREYYLSLCRKDGYSSRELDRQIDSCQFERAALSNQKLSAVLRELHPLANNCFKDNYVLEFLGLPEEHSERKLQTALVAKMKQFILELGKDFIFIAKEYRLQVGNQDFYIDLLFFHRGLSALVAFELKVEKFSPEHLGQLNFYLEALDRDVKMPHENPSIGVLLCKDKDDEVVEYAHLVVFHRHLWHNISLNYPIKKSFKESSVNYWMGVLKNDYRQN